MSKWFFHKIRNFNYFKKMKLIAWLMLTLIISAGCVKSEDGGTGNSDSSVNKYPELVSTFGRGSNNSPGEMNFPSGIALDGNGNVYICNDVDSMVSKFDNEGNFITKWVVQDCLGLDTDNDNNVYIASTEKNKVVKYTSEGVLIREWNGGGDVQFKSPKDLAINKNLGRLYVMDSGNCSVQVFNTDGEFLFKWGDCTQFSSWVRSHGIAVNRVTDEVYVCDSANSKVQKFDKDGNFIVEWGGLGRDEGKIKWNRGIDVDGNGNVYIADGDNERISKFDSVGNFIMHIQGLPDTFEPSCSPHNSHVDCTALHNKVNGPFHPRAVVVDPQGNVYVAAGYSFRIDKFDSSGRFLKTWGWWEKDKGVFNRPSGIAIDKLRGYIYIADTYNFLIQKFDLNGNYILSWGYSGRVGAMFNGGDGGFDFAHSITTDNDGNVYVIKPDSYYEGDPEMKRIQKFDQNGNFLMSWNYGDYVGQENMEGIVYNSYTNSICVSNSPANKIQCFDTAGNFLFEFGSTGYGDGQFFWPAKSAVDGNDGSIYVIDISQNSIQKFSSTGSFMTKWGGAGSGDGEFLFSSYSGIYVDEAGYVYVSDSSNRRIQVFDSSGNFIFKWSSSVNPTGIVVDSYGYIYSIDPWRNELYKFPPIPH